MVLILLNNFAFAIVSNYTLVTIQAASLEGQRTNVVTDYVLKVID